jgi:hypothetical protein
MLGDKYEICTRKEVDIARRRHVRLFEMDGGMNKKPSLNFDFHTQTY